ncbi:hypothetical protein FPV67DRAFT_1785727 [Lyophyllum atratum]|nr:hypothetical protein FPV67DRAFT_1785727 [Lyophyllum atratum]
MGQQFEFVNLDNPFPVSRAVCGKFGEFFWRIDEEEDNAVMEALWQTEESHKIVAIAPYSQLKRAEKPLRIWNKCMTFPEESLANATLPTELVSMILEEVEDLADLICFVLTCQRYFEIGRPILEARFEDTLTYSWAGNRLICFGDNAEFDDLPEGMLTEDEKELIDKKYPPCDPDKNNNYGLWEQLSFVQTLQPDSHLNQKRVIFHQENPRLSYYFMRLQETWDYHERVHNRPRVGWAGMRDVEVLNKLTKTTSRGPVSEMYGSYVLRNLTTKEYIRGAAICEAWDTPDLPYLRALRFMHLLVLRITWSHDSSLNIRYYGPIEVHRGVWAGHRFDFVDIKTVEDEQGTIGDWKDVSDDVIDELVAVFEEEAEDMNRYL